MLKDIAFTVSGILEIPDNAKPSKNGTDKNGYKFALRDGRVVRLAVVIELEDGDAWTDLKTCAEMETVGFYLLDYDVSYMAV